MSRYYRVSSVIDLAVIPKVHPEEAPPIPPPTGTPISDRARAQVARVGRSSLDVRDALSAIADALGGLEREVDRLQRVLLLRDQGVELSTELVAIGGDGLSMQRRCRWPDGAQVHVMVGLTLRDARQLFVMSGVVQAQPEGCEIRFVDLTADTRDLLVAYTFQQQARERRRVLDAAG